MLQPRPTMRARMAQPRGMREPSRGRGMPNQRGVGMRGGRPAFPARPDSERN